MHFWNVPSLNMQIINTIFQKRHCVGAQIFFMGFKALNGGTSCLELLFWFMPFFGLQGTFCSESWILNLLALLNPENYQYGTKKHNLSEFEVLCIANLSTGIWRPWIGDFLAKTTFLIYTLFSLNLYFFALMNPEKFNTARINTIFQERHCVGAQIFSLGSEGLSWETSCSALFFFYFCLRLP